MHRVHKPQMDQLRNSCEAPPNSKSRFFFAVGAIGVCATIVVAYQWETLRRKNKEIQRLNTKIKYQTTHNAKLVQSNETLQKTVDEMKAKNTQNTNSESIQNDYELAITACKEIEQIFKTQLKMSASLSKAIEQAKSSGLISKGLARNLHYIANTRNNLCHKSSYEAIKDKTVFKQKYSNARGQLLAACKKLPPGNKT